MLRTLGGLFTTTIHTSPIHTSLRRLFGGSKNQRNPIPKHVELQKISTYSNQWPTNKNRCWSTHFSAKFKFDRSWRRILKTTYQSTNYSKKKNCSRRNLFNQQFHQSQKSVTNRRSIVHQQSRKTGLWKKGIKENSSSSLHTQWAIDQGATRLGGL